jgi:hypothetical protein
MAVKNPTYHIKAARKDFSAARTMTRNRRLGRYQGRNGGGDASYHLRSAAAHLSFLSARVQGLLTEEHKLAKRLSENKDVGQNRPELQARLNEVRKQIRSCT